MTHLRTVLDREPGHAEARLLLERVETAWRIETAFERQVTPHFVVKAPASAGAPGRQAVAALLEAVHDRLGGELDFAPRERVTVILYEPRQLQAVTGVHEWAAGVFDGKIRLPLAGRLPSARHLERLVIHEYAHAAIHQVSRGRAPRWLHEGLAQVLEGGVADIMLRAPAGLTVAGIEALTADPDPIRARAGYELALWVVQDLMDRGGMDAMRELLARLGRAEPLAEAIAGVYALRLGELEAQWQRVLGG